MQFFHHNSLNISNWKPMGIFLFWAILYISTRRQLQYLRVATIVETVPLWPPNSVPKVPKNDATGERRGSRKRGRRKGTMKKSKILTQGATLEGPASDILWMETYCHMIDHINLLIRSGMVLSCYSADPYCMLYWCIASIYLILVRVLYYFLLEICYGFMRL